METRTERQNRFINPDELDWQEGTPGIRKRVLYEDPVTGAHTLLVEFRPGAATTRYGPHPNGEEVYVLRGTFLDGDKVCPAGTFIHYPPGSAHMPRSDEGCLCLITVPGPGNFSR